MAKNNTFQFFGSDFCSGYFMQMYAYLSTKILQLFSFIYSEGSYGGALSISILFLAKDGKKNLWF